MLGVGSEHSWLCSEVCSISTSACVGDVADDAEWVSSGRCAGLGVGATSYDVEAAGARVDRFPAVRGVLTLGPSEAVLPGGESLEGAVLFVSERKEGKLLGFLLGIGKEKIINI